MDKYAHAVKQARLRDMIRWNYFMIMTPQGRAITQRLKGKMI